MDLTTNPARMAKYKPIFSFPKVNHTTGKATRAMRTAEKLVPLLRDFNRSFWLAPSLVRTKKVPNIEQRIPSKGTAASKGNEASYGMGNNA